MAEKPTRKEETQPWAAREVKVEVGAIAGATTVWVAAKVEPGGMVVRRSRVEEMAATAMHPA
jgi:hypothetical protein